METLTIIEKTNTSGNPITLGQSIKINPEKLIGVSTSSLYIRKGFLNGTLFLSQKRNGANGAGDLCRLDSGATLEVNANLFDRIKIYAEKAGAIA